MATTTQHAPGTFSWPELATSDQDGAKKFYTTLFGWTYEDNDMGPEGTYTMLKLRGESVGALYKMRPEQAASGMPPCWGSYVTVENVDQATVKARGLGAKVMMEPFDVMDVGRMAVIADPQGAVFSLWQARKHIGATVLDEVGALCWTELMTTDASAAEKFYTGLFGWKPESMPMGPGMTYTVFKRGETAAGGMMQITADMGPIPPNWGIYFQVADCDASAAKAASMGAQVVVPPKDIPNVGRFAILIDPQGAHFAILKQ
jgi:predicted enzyme related to lactoylglutathione lyase